MTTPARGRRGIARRLAFNVRALMVAVALVGGGLGWAIHRVRVQHEAVDRVGGEWAVSYRYRNVADWPRRLPFWRRASLRLLGRWHDELFETTSYLVSNQHPPPPGWAEAVPDLRGLHTIQLEDAGVTDADLAGIGRARNLVTLEVGANRITDAGVAHLAGLDRLVVLYLLDNDITDASLETLARLPSLETLDLGGTRVTDAGLPHLLRSTSLRDVGLRGTAVTPAAAAEFARALDARWAR